MALHPLVFFISSPAQSSTLILDALKTDGFTVHCFDDLSFALSCVDPTCPPRLILCIHPEPSFETWDAIQTIPSFQSESVTIACLIVHDNLFDTMALSEGLSLHPDSLIASPVQPAVIVQRARHLIDHPPGPPLRTLIIFDPDNQLPENHQNALRFAGFHLQMTGPGIQPPIPSPDAITCFLIIPPANTSIGSEVIQQVTSRYPHPIIIIMRNSTSESTQSSDVALNGTGQSHADIPLNCRPDELVRTLERGITSILMKQMVVQAGLDRKELESRSRLYQQVVDQQEDLICKWMPDGILTFVNPAFCRSAGKSRREIVGMSLFDCIPRKYHDSFMWIRQRIMRNRRTEVHEFPFMAMNETETWFLWTSQPLFDPDGRIMEILSDGRDITERKNLELVLKKKNEEQEILLENIATQVWYLQDTDTYGRINKAHADFIGIASADVTGKKMKDVLNSTDAATIGELIRDVYATRKTVYSEKMMTNSIGERRLLDITVTPWLDPEEAVTFLVCSAMDITRQRMLEFSMAFRAEFEHLISEVSSTFVQYTPEKLETAIQDSLQQIGIFMGVDRIFFLRSGDSDPELFQLFEWRQSGHGLPEDNKSTVPPHLWGELESVDRVSFSWPEDIPETAAVHRYYSDRQIRSALYLPIREYGALNGMIGLESMRSAQAWDDEIQFLLKFYGELILHTLQKKQAASIIRMERDIGIHLSTAANLDESLQLCLDHALQISGMDCGGIYLTDTSNQKLRLVKHVGLSEGFVRAVSEIDKGCPRYSLLDKGTPIYGTYDMGNNVADPDVKNEGLKAIGVIPIRYGNEIIACLNLSSHHKKLIPIDARIALEAMASRLGPSIAKALSDQQIRRDRENLDNLLNSIEDFLFIFTPEGHIIHTNAAARTKLGYHPACFSDIRIDSIYGSDPETNILSALTRCTEQLHTVLPFHITSRDGTLFPTETRVVAGEWLGTPAFFCISHDLSHLRKEEEKRLKLERHVQQVRKVESLGRMAGAIAHRFNNLLMGVIGNLELAKMMIQTDRDPLDKIRMAEETAHQATELGKLMLTYIGQEVSKPELCNLTEAIHAVIPLVLPVIPSNVVLEKNLAHDLPGILINASALKQIIINLVTNAWESFEGLPGRIIIETGCVDPDTIPTMNLVEGDREKLKEAVFLLIADTGQGMPMEVMDKMFDPFYSTRFTGRGLGLSTVQGIVRANEGWIAVVSQAGKGTQVMVMFPPVAETNPQEASTGPFRKSGDGGLILLVEPDPIERAAGTMILKELGFAVLPVSSGPEAVTRLTTYQDTLRMILIDQGLPGSGSRRLIMHIREVNTRIPIVLVRTSRPVSGESAETVNTLHGIHHGIQSTHPESDISELDVIIEKPYRFTELSEITRDLLLPGLSGHSTR
ncbi:PAS domain S-box protein [bacterium]|nr:PAS domain S-box protein [candidate division CSSED10-310 bacterium]